MQKKIIDKMGLLLAIICFASGLSMQGQSKEQKQADYEQNKVELFSVQERDNTQMWVQEQIEAMELSEQLSNDYSVILIYYLSKIRRLDDKDNFRSKEELLRKMDEIVLKQNNEVKDILNEEQYEKHLEFYNKMTLMRKNRIEERF